MKYAILTVAFMSLALGFLCARSARTETSAAHTNVVLFMNSDFRNNNNDLPTSFDDIPGLREAVESEPWMLNKINVLALVPSAPTIHPGQDISQHYHGKKLFAIGRTENFDYSSKSKAVSSMPGRYAIVFDSNDRTSIPSWIPEVEVQAILRQIKDFDPSKQPFAFQDLIPAKNGPKKHDVPQSGGVNKQEKQHASATHLVERIKENRWSWIVGAAALIVLLIWGKIRKFT